MAAIAKGGSAQTFNMSGGMGTATKPTAAGCFSLWEGTTQVVPDTPYASLPVTVNGVTCSRCAHADPGVNITLAISANSSVPSYTGAFAVLDSDAGNQYATSFDITGANAGAGGSTTPANLTFEAMY